MAEMDTVLECVDRKCREFERLFKAREITKMVNNFYSPDAVMEGFELPAQEGRDAIAHIFVEAREACASIEIELEPLTVVGSLAYGNITNRNKLLSGGVEMHRVLMIWQQIDGDWFVVRDFFFAEHSLLLNALNWTSSDRPDTRRRKPRGRPRRSTEALHSVDIGENSEL